MFRWGSEKTWSGVRRGSKGACSPIDLREAYAAGRGLAEAYGDLVDAWEFENEPDIPFFADNADVFAAMHKAVALGIAAGGAGQSAGAPAQAGRRCAPQGAGGELLATRTAPSLVLMAAPALPPGPHFEQLLANGYLAYTEGFNYHYYGFAMDYAGVYESFRGAVQKINHQTHETHKRWRRTEAERRRLPVFLTEWGYSLLDGYDAQTVEGRVRQWRYFKEVAQENERLGIAAPMAFLLRPYFEYKAKEFGLTMPVAEARLGHFGFVVDGERERQVAEGRGQSPEPSGQSGRSQMSEVSGSRRAGLPATFHAGGLMFTPEDFGAEGGGALDGADR